MTRAADPQTLRVTSRRSRIIGGLAIAGAVLGIALPACGGGGSGAATSDYQVRAIFDSAAFIIEGLDVKVAGVKVGQVLGVELTDENQAAVTFVITDAGFQDLREDATCGIRPQALIGERYLDCTLTQQRPEGASPPPELAVIEDGPYRGQRLLPEENTSISVDPDLLLNTSNLSARARLAIIVRELGVGLEGRGEKLETALDKGNDALVLTNQILKQLDGQTDVLKDLTTSSDRVLASLAAERASISGTIENGAIVDSTLAARKNELAASIASLDRVLTEIEPTTDKALELTSELKPIASDLNASADDLATVIDDLPQVAAQSEAALTALGPTVDKARDVLTSDDTSALIDRYAKTAAVVNQTGRVLGLTLGDFRTTGGLDYFLDAIYGLAYSTNGRDANGAYLRASALATVRCSLPLQVSETGCGTRLADDQQGRLSAADRRAGSTETAPGRAAARSSASRTAAPSQEAAAAKLLFGGTR